VTGIEAEALRNIALVEGSRENGFTWVVLSLSRVRFEGEMTGEGMVGVLVDFWTSGSCSIHRVASRIKSIGCGYEGECSGN